MARYRCYNCPPRAPGQYREFEADKPSCPKCGAGSPAVIKLEDVHFVLPDPEGEILGANSIRLKIACEPKREYLALVNTSYSASGDPRAVTCPSCRGVPEWQEQMKAMSQAEDVIAQTVLRAHESGREASGGCC